MKLRLLKTSLFAALVALSYGCSKEDDALSELEPLAKTNPTELTAGQEIITFDKYVMGDDGFMSEVWSDQNSGPIMVDAYQRIEGNSYRTKNVANIFNSNQPWSPQMNSPLQVDDILTANEMYPGGTGKGAGGATNDTEQGNLMIINRTNDPAQALDYNGGGKMMFDFSSLGTVTMSSVTVIDVDHYEAGGKVVLYGLGGNVLYETTIGTVGDNGKIIVDLKNTAGVASMMIILGPEAGWTGSGAIDDIVFMREMEEEYGCTRTQGYWKTHASGRKYDATWGNLPNTTFYSSGMTYLELMNTAPKGGNAYVTLAHQYIAAVLNTEVASAPENIDDIIRLATAYFNNPMNTLNNPYNGGVSRATLIDWAGQLAAYNEGKIGPDHCD